MSNHEEFNGERSKLAQELLEAFQTRQEEFGAERRRFIQEELGATGKFPQGKLTPDDEGELMFAVGADITRAVLDHADGIDLVEWDTRSGHAISEHPGALRAEADVVVTSFAYNTSKIAAAPESIEALWDARFAGKVGWRDDAVEAVSFAAIALGQDPNAPSDLAAVKDKLLALPEFMRGSSAQPDADAVLCGFRLTTFFLERNVYGPRGLELPETRARVLGMLEAGDG